jgi:uncharacterized protein YndB with AHSA1/START domain
MVRRHEKGTTDMSSRTPAHTAVIAAGSNTQFSHSVTVDAPAQRVWSIWMDVPKWPTWDIELEQARASAPLALGVKGSVTPRAGFSSSFEVTEFEPGRCYAIEVPLPLARLVVKRELRQTGGSTRFVHQVKFSGIAAPVFAALFGPRYRIALPKVMALIADQALATR